MPLSMKRNEEETWKECALRYAKVEGLEWEVGEFYDIFIENGEPPYEAAFNALREWDLLDYKE